jgi:hypothetical protein
MTRTSFQPAIWAALLMLAALALHGPIAQLADYHAFADQRSAFGIAHVGDVLSNLAFLLAAAYGAWRQRAQAWSAPERACWRLFLWALVLTAAGSSWYHLAPDDARLVWDRLPIALACAALLALALRSRLALLLLAAGAIASVCWWRATGDLRPYLLLQGAPLVLIPLLQWRAGVAAPQRRAFGLAVALYVLAKLCEVGDHAGYALLAVVSGHTLKHVLAALAAAVLAHAFGDGPRPPLAVS